MTPPPAEVAAAAAAAGGFVPPAPAVYRVEAADEDLAGLWMRVRSCTLGQLLDLGFGPPGSGPAGERDPREVFGEFAGRLVEWNVCDPDTGEPVPPTYAGLRSLDEDFARRLLGLWENAITGVPAPFVNASNGGPPAPPMPLPMTPATGSQESAAS